MAKDCEEYSLFFYHLLIGLIQNSNYQLMYLGVFGLFFGSPVLAPFTSGFIT